MEAPLPQLLEPGLERGVIDARIGVAGRDVLAHEGRDAVSGGEDLAGAGDEVHLGQGEHAVHGVGLVEGAGGVLDAAAAVERVGVDAAGVTVAHERDEADVVFELQAQELVVQAGGPGELGEEPGGEHGDGFEFGAVTGAVEVLELVADGREDAAFPGAGLFVEGGADDHGRVEVEVPADVAVAKTAAEE